MSMFSKHVFRTAGPAAWWAVAVLILATVAHDAQARNNIRSAFFEVYPDAVGTVIETVPSQPNHCGVCHYDFTGGGPRNLYGQRLEAVLPDFPSNPSGRRQAVRSIETEDPDLDGFSTLIEVTDTATYDNTPTFPGLTPLVIDSVSNVDITEIQAYLVPSSGADTTPPVVTVIAPNGGETLVANTSTTVQWTATDEGGIAGIELYVSDDGGATFIPVMLSLPHTGSFTWFPANRPTTQAIFRVVAIDNAFNRGQDDSDDVFTIESPPGGLVPTTLRDFDMPGSQPFEAGTLNSPTACAPCHGNYNPDVEPYFNWQGSMMAHASRDILFEACLAVANQDAPDAGDVCLRCHISRGWLRGRSVPTDGTQMLPEDMMGVSCDLCHRLVDPIYDPANPAEDVAILAALRMPPSGFGNGMAVVDPTGARRGPFVDATGGHPILVSPFHREAALCGTCHDVSNPAFSKDEESGSYPPNELDHVADDFAADHLMPIERTYSEWLHSEYNSAEGVYAPQFGGNRDFVSTCQHCHMRAVTGQGCNFGSPPTRDDLPLHDMTGGSTWLAGLLSSMYPDDVNEAALQAGIDRARYMLQNAATMDVVQEGRQLKVTVTNDTGHKLPTGYPEGRRMWLNVRFYDAAMALIHESGAYDAETGVLSHDEDAKIYEVKPGLDTDVGGIIGEDAGPSFHFVLNNKVYKDNRIPPRGFTNAAFAEFGGAPVGHSYEDGQYWDDTFYPIPSDAASVEVTLYYQSTSKEYVEFLRDENTTNSTGQDLYDLWTNNGKSPPELMRQAQLAVEPPLPGDYNGDGVVDLADYAYWDGCMTGPDNGPYPPDCETFDFDEDGDVDAKDFGGFQASIE